jgi:drug/metabolite transporter (DMT)-like permease
MTTLSSDHRKGLAITAIGGLVLTVDIPLIRLAQGEPWSIMLLRSGATLAAALLIWTIWRLARGKAPALVPGRKGLIVSALYGLTAVTFIMAVYNTSTANVVFILAFNTMFAALLSWIVLKERPRNVTLAAMALMMVGVFIIVGDGIGSGNLLGDVLALCSAFFIACAITISRGSGEDMGFTALVAVVAPFAVAIAMVSQVGYSVEAPWWILFNGAVVMPIAFFCLATGPRYISGPEVAMFYLLETVLAPVWVWLIFSEVPTRASMIGGAILIATLVAHSVWQLAEGRRRRAVPVLRHPA